MNLRDFRRLFVQTSGRYDLWNEDGSDNGADRLINLGQRYIETLMHWDKMQAVQNITLVGVSNFMLPNVRVIKRISARVLSTDRFVDLVRITLSQARKYVMDEIDATGLPLFYTLFRHRGQMATLTNANFFDATAAFQDVTDKQNYDSVGILLTPIILSSETVEIEVEGMFRQPALSADDDSNYWTSEWHNLLLYAALRELEILHRNSQGVKDWDQSINTLLIQHEMDFVQDDSWDVDVILG